MLSEKEESRVKRDGNHMKRDDNHVKRENSVKMVQNGPEIKLSNLVEAPFQIQTVNCLLHTAV